VLRCWRSLALAGRMQAVPPGDGGETRDRLPAEGIGSEVLRESVNDRSNAIAEHRHQLDRDREKHRHEVC